MGFAPDKGAGLVFNVLPAVFNKMPVGWLWAGLFFLLLCVAALTSGVSLLEVAVSYFVDERKWSRHKAVLFCAAAIILSGILSAISIINWNSIEWLHNWMVTAFNIKSSSFLNTMDSLSADWLLPLGGLVYHSLSAGYGEPVKRSRKYVTARAISPMYI